LPNFKLVIKSRMTGWACGTYGKRCMQCSGGETWGTETTWKTLV